MLSVAHPSLLISILVHLSQATLFGLAIAALLLALPFVPARFRHFLGWLGLAKFVLPLAVLGFVLPAGMPHFFSGTWLPTLQITDPLAKVPAPLSSFELIMRATVIVWLLGATAFAALTGWRALRFTRQLRKDRMSFSPEEQARLAALAVRAGVKPACVQGYTTPAQVAPGVSGIFRSRIHVPRELLHTLTRDETEAVLLHELVHVARRDNLWRQLQAGIVCLGWFHPLVWWLHRRLILESERACDEAVVRLTRDRETYAQGLLKAARFALGLDVPGFSGMARNGLKTRLVALLNPTTKKDHPMLRYLLTLITLVGFALTSGTAAEPDTTAPENEPYGVAKLDVQPYPISQARPHYPLEMIKEKIDGEAVVSFIVDASGGVKDAFVTRSTRREFEAPALEAINQWKFKPGMKGGRPVNTRLTVPIVYSMNRK